MNTTPPMPSPLRPLMPALIRARAWFRTFVPISIVFAATTACEANQGSMGGKPTLGDGTGATGTDSDGASEDATADETGDAIPEGPRRRRLDIAAGFVAEPGGATLLVVLDDTRIEYEDTQPGGADLRFYGPDQATAYPFEIEQWSPGGRSYVWVRIEEASLPDHLWMYYADGEAFDLPDPTNAWDGAFSAVWHMTRGEGTFLADATGHGNILVPMGFAGELEDVGRIGVGTTFVPDDAPVEIGPLELQDASRLALEPAITIEAWVSPAVTEADRTHYVLRKGTDYELRSLEPTSTRPKLVLRTAGVAGAHTVEAGASLGLNAWSYLVATYRAEDGTMTIYRNGEAEAMGLVGGADARARALAVSDAVVQIGRNFEGKLDEVRVSTIARSGSWVRLQYASMSDTLLTYGAPEAR